MIGRIALALALAAGVLPAAADPIAAIGPVLLVDGDTIKIDGVTIRLLDIDTPETYRSRCEAELILGLKAKQRLRELLDSGPVTFKATGHDRYRRTLAKVYAGRIDVGKRLLSEGHALPYAPGAEAKARRQATWCPAR